MNRRESPLRFCPRFSLRSLIVMVTLSSLGFAQFYYELRSSQGRRAAVERLGEFPGGVHYESGRANRKTTKQWDAPSGFSGRVRVWLIEQLGVDFFFDVRSVCISGRDEFSDADFSATCRLRKIHSLRLGNTVVTDEGIRPVSQLTELKSLTISSPWLSDEALVHIAKLKHLENLYLFDVAVTDTGLAKLAELDRLKYVTLTKTGVTQEGAAALQMALPNCRITLKP